MKKTLSETMRQILFVLTIPFLFAQTSFAQDKTIVEIASENDDFSTLVEAVVKAELVETLSGDGPFTVFAPNNAAFDALFASLGVSGIEDLSKEALTPILLYHVVAGTVLSTDLMDGQIAPTVNGNDVKIGVSDAGVMVNESNVIAPDIIASNGVIHVIDMVLLPPMNIVEIASGNPDFSILVEAVVKADLVDALSGDDDLTVFAPTNDAFVALLEATEGVSSLDDLTKEQVTDILLYHVLGGKTYAASLSDGLVATTLKGDDVQFSISDAGAKINDSNIVATDIIASNGVIHVIDMVLLPPMNIVEIASGNPDFSILVEAVVKADLVDALSGDDDLTVFAPTNDAFVALLEATEGVSSLDDLTKEQVTDILLYHVLGGKTYAASLSDGLVATTLKGDDVQFSISDAGAKINDSNIVATDIIASNGVIHVIDMVLLPPMNIVEIASGNPDFSVLVEAVVKADLVDALSGDNDLTVFAPTNAAFEMLFDALGVSGIADLSKEALTPILLYHVLGGKTYSNDLSDGQMAETLNGRMVTFKVNDMGIMVNESNISPADIIASNGVIHVIDKVLLPPADMVTSFTLVDPETNEDLFEITEGMEIDLSKISATKFNIRANVSPKKVGSVKFGWNENDNVRIENVFPYALFGDVGGNYYESDLKAGKYTVTATPYSKSVASGDEGKALSVNFSVISTGGGVIGFTLIDAITDEDITEIFDGDVIHLTTLINIRADLNIDSEEIMSVKFDLNDHEGFRVERVFPYALIGDSGGDYYEWKPEPGMYTITASPMLKDGTEGKPLTIKIELVDKTVGNSSKRAALDPQSLSKDNLKFYPNPAIEQINLELKARENDKITVRVLDLNGRIFLSEEFKTSYNLNNYQLNVSSLQRGIYILSVDSNTQGRQLVRFVKD